MRADDFRLFLEAIEVIQAQEMLAKLRIQDWSNMKDKPRRDFHRELKRLAYSEAEEKTMSPKEFMEKLKSTKNGR